MSGRRRRTGDPETEGIRRLSAECPDSSHQNALSSARNGPREERGGAIGNRSPTISQGATFVELPGEERAELSIENFAQYFNLLLGWLSNPEVTGRDQLTGCTPTIFRFE